MNGAERGVRAQLAIAEQSAMIGQLLCLTSPQTADAMMTAAGTVAAVVAPTDRQAREHFLEEKLMAFSRAFREVCATRDAEAVDPRPRTPGERESGGGVS